MKCDISGEDQATCFCCQSMEHLEFVLRHDGLIPEPGFGGCSCADCAMLRKWIADNPEKCARIVRVGL